MKSLSVLLVLIGCIAFLVPLDATTYYVDQNNPAASDTNPGTEDLPWLRLKHATDNAAIIAGDTVVVKPGRYVDSTATSSRGFSPVNSGAAANPIVFVSRPRLAAIVCSFDNTKVAWSTFAKDYIVIDGFRAEGQLQIRGDMPDSSNYCVIENCEVVYGSMQGPGDSSLHWGIAIHGPAEFNTIRNNYVHDMSMPNHYWNTHNTACVMVLAGSRNVIEHNLADGAMIGGDTCNAFGQKGGQIYFNTWRYNIVRNASSGFVGMGSTNDLYFSMDNAFYQNTIINSTRAFELHHNCKRFDIYNNVAYNCDRLLSGGGLSDSAIQNTEMNLWNNIAYRCDEGYRLDSPSNSWTSLLNYSDYNDFMVTQMAIWNWGSQYCTTLADWQTATGFDSNSIALDPLFVDTTTHDFHLQNGSPCLNAGIDRQDYDNDGDTLEAINMGAYITGDENIGPTAVTERMIDGRCKMSDERLKITPNPFMSFATVQGHERENFVVYDVLGRRAGIYRSARIGADLRAGVYFIQTNDQRSAEKVVKLK